VSTNLQIAAPDFDLIEHGDLHALADAIRLLWYVQNNEISVRTQTVNRAQNRVSPKVLVSAPTTAQHNFDAGDTGTLLFTGSTAFSLTGIRNGVEGRRLKIHNLGSGTITLEYEHGSSDAGNRFDTVTGANKTVAIGQTADLEHLSGRWRLASFI